MTREDLYRMVGGEEEKFQEAIDAILANIKPAFVTTCMSLEKVKRQKLVEAIQK